MVLNHIYIVKMVDAFGARRVTVKAPERGIFPLDHDGQCTDKMKVL